MWKTPGPSATPTPWSFFPQHIKFPSIATIDYATTDAQQLVTALSNTKPNTPLEKVGNQQLAALRILAQKFWHTSSLNKPGYEAPNHTVKPRVEASNPSVQKQLPPLQTTTLTHRYPTHITYAANLTGAIDGTNFQDVIPGHIPVHAVDAARQFANAIIDNNTGEAFKYQHLITKDKYREVWTNYFSKELDQLAQGRAQLASGTNTLFFLKYEYIPANWRKDVTCGRVVVDYRF